jgi:hypothetical protein
MENLFSHAAGSDVPQPIESLDPIICTAVVPGPVSRAFMGFTDHTHLWWPMETNSVYGPGSYVEFEENVILESSDDGRSATWGTIDDWQPPLSFHASWYPGSTALWSTELRVVFRGVKEGTEVRVVHDGWEGAEDPAGTRAAWEKDWPAVLNLYVRFMGGASD